MKERVSYYVSESGAEAGRSDSKLAVLAVCRTGPGYLGLKDLRLQRNCAWAGRAPGGGWGAVPSQFPYTPRSSFTESI